jgi:beta-lactamase regulating signal transducer with metallopeptidase domain
MITPAVLLFSLSAAAMVWLAGRRDAARDPRLTLVILILLAGFPLLSLLPKIKLAGLPEAGLAWAAWLGWAWAAGALLCSLRLVVALVQLTLWRRRSRPVDDPDFAGHHPEIRLLEGLNCPVAAGIIRPLILVPPAWHGWSQDLRKTVIAHESAHHARRDPMWRAIAAITCTLHWFNPLVWWMASRLSQQCEYACDERVVKTGSPAKNYARDLCDVASVCRAPATTLAMASHHGLEARVRRMLAPPPAGSSAGVWCLGLLALMSAVAFAIIERHPVEFVPALDTDDIRTRLDADPFPGNGVDVTE